MGGKASQNGARGVMKVVAKVLLFLGLEGLGGVLGPPGAQEPILIDFWLIFDGF